MAYHFYLCGEELPVEPKKLVLKIKGKNKTLDLLSGQEINILKSPGLTDISFSATLPMFDAAHKPDFYLEKFEKFKVKKKPTQFIVTRTTPDGKALFDTNLKVAIEDYSITEDADEPFDVSVELKLKQYVHYGTQSVKLDKIGGQTVASITKERETLNAPSATSYKSKPGDTLWSIASKYLGDGARAKDIFGANQDLMTDPNILKPGTKLRIPR